MAVMLGAFPATITPTPEDTRLAQKASQQLAKLLQGRKKNVRFRIQPTDQPDQTVTLPLSILRLLADILCQMAKGNPVTLIPTHVELTTQQAADLLLVSRPYLIKLLDEGKIPYRTVGKHRRIRFEDLMAYKRKDDEERLKVLEELSALDQELGGMGY